MIELSAFQVATEAQLLRDLELVGSGFTWRHVRGERETYIHAGLAGSAAEVFIYDDEAQLLGPSVDIRFEVPDYSDSDQLRVAFVQAVISHAKDG